MPAAEIDTTEGPVVGLAGMAAVRELNIDDAHMHSIIWATYFGSRFDFLDRSLLDASGAPPHNEGVCEVPGLYCLGSTWLRRWSLRLRHGR